MRGEGNCGEAPARWTEARLSANVWSGINNGLAMSLVDEMMLTFLIGG